MPGPVTSVHLPVREDWLERRREDIIEPDLPIVDRPETGRYLLPELLRDTGRRDEVFAEWRARIGELAACPNVHVKLGGLGMRLFGFDFHERDLPPSSEELAAAWRPYIETCLAAFGARRAMFESNFPVDKGSCGYAVLWNGFKRIAAGCSAAEKEALFSGTARTFYRLGTA